MTDSFQDLFNHAAAMGFTLKSFHQMKDGSFRANWRRDDSEIYGVAQFAAVAESRDPYHALKNSLAIAERTLPIAAAAVETDDLFGGVL